MRESLLTAPRWAVSRRRAPVGSVLGLEAWTMRIESSGHSQGNPRLYELVEHSPKPGKSATVWAGPELMDYLKIAGQPVAGPWPPHQEPRPDPTEDSLPVAVPDPESRPAAARREGAPAHPNPHP